MIVRTALALALAGAVVDPAAVRETEQFRTKHEADYRRDYVTLAGLFSLHDGVNTVGSATTNAIVLPKPAPAIVGRLIVTAGRVRFEPVKSGTSEGAPSVTLKGRAVTAPIDLKSDENDPADELAVGGVTLWVHMSGDRRTIRLRDVNGAPAKAFEGFHWFPIDPAYRVTARFIKDPAPHDVKIPNQLVATKKPTRQRASSNSQSTARRSPCGR
jgi:uncharacterized protein (DUF1684 family)